MTNALCLSRARDLVMFYNFTFFFTKTTCLLYIFRNKRGSPVSHPRGQIRSHAAASSTVALVPIPASVASYLKAHRRSRIFVFNPTCALNDVEVEVVLAADNILEAPCLERPRGAGGLTFQAPVKARSPWGLQDF